MHPEDPIDHSAEEIQDSSDELYQRFVFNADKGQEPYRIDKFLMNRIEGATRNKLQQAINAGLILVNNKEVKQNYKIKAYDQIVVYSDLSPESTEIVPEKIDLNIVFEDDDLLVINKPAGLVVHPGSGNYSGTLLNGVAHYLKNEDPSITEEVLPRFGLVHRIDKNTSGLLVLAKTDKAMRQLAKQFYDHTVKRHYRAVVWGDFEKQEGTIIAHVGRNLRHRKLFEAYPEGDHGKEAITHYRVLESFNYVSLVECVLETGRTHQIRVHMKHLGHPIVCDELYGDGKPVLISSIKKKNYNLSKEAEEERPILSRLALHATSLKFSMKGKEYSFEAPLPKDLKALLQQLRKNN